MPRSTVPGFTLASCFLSTQRAAETTRIPAALRIEGEKSLRAVGASLTAALALALVLAGAGVRVRLAAALALALVHGLAAGLALRGSGRRGVTGRRGGGGSFRRCG